MIEDTIGKIEDRIQQASSIASDKKEELLALLAALKTEVGEISQSHRATAQAIAGHTEASANEATRSEPDPVRLDTALEDLSESVEGFEKSHPKLVEVVNRICVTLSNLGI